MRKAFFLSAALLAAPAFASQPPDFASLQSLTAADIAADTGAGGEKKWGVTYSLNGRLTLAEGRKTFRTADGRVFELDLSDRKARRFDGRHVHIKAAAKQSDDMSVLKVEDIEEFSPSLHEAVLPPYQPKRRRAEVGPVDGPAITAANVRWHGEGAPSPESFDWATAVIRPELLKNVYFVKKPFPPEWLAAHSLFLFTFGKGGLTDAAGREASGLVLTIEAFLRDGQEYGLMDGMKDKFGIVWMLTTWEDYSSRTALNDGARLIPYRVELPAADARRLLRESLALAGVNREGEFYDTITNNCTNNLLVLINRVLPGDRRIRMWTIPYLIYNVRATMPVAVPGYLQRKGLLGPELPVLDASNYAAPLD